MVLSQTNNILFFSKATDVECEREKDGEYEKKNTPIWQLPK